MAQAEARISRGVRDLVITLLRDVQAQPAGERQPPSAMLARNAERLSASLADDPQGRDTLLAMAQLYYQLNDYVGASAVELIGPGESAGTYREIEVKGGVNETVRMR